MTTAPAEPTAALTTLEPRPVVRTVTRASELESAEIEEILSQHDQRALLFGIAAAVVCGPLAAVAAQSLWLAPFVAAVVVGIGGTIGQALRRRDAARQLGVSTSVLDAVERRWTRATFSLLAEDVRQKRWRSMLFRRPAQLRAELAPRIHALLQRDEG